MREFIHVSSSLFNKQGLKVGVFNKLWYPIAFYVFIYQKICQ
jgi:hypothetical protein